MQSQQAGGENGGQFIKPLIRSHFGGALVVAQDGPPCRWVVGNFEPLAERGGSTPFNLLPVAAGGGAAANNSHPASTHYEVAAWWVKYLLPKGGVLLDCFAGSGTMLLSGLDFG